MSEAFIDIRLILALLPMVPQVQGICGVLLVPMVLQAFFYKEVYNKVDTLCTLKNSHSSIVNF